MAPGKVDAAVAAVEARPDEAPAWQGRIQLPSSGRSVVLRVPADFTVNELVDLVAYCTTQLGDDIAKASRPASRLLLPRH